MPAVHDVAAVRRSQEIYAELRRKTAWLALEPVSRALEEVTSSSALSDLQAQLRGLQELLLDRPVGDRAGRDDLAAQLRPFVDEDVRQLEVDPSLSEDMASEFATALLDTVLRRFRSNAREQVVLRADLEILRGDRAGDDWTELNEALVPYGVSGQDAKRIVWNVLEQLSKEGDGGEYFELPNGLRLSRPMMGRIACGAEEPSSGRGHLAAAREVIREIQTPTDQRDLSAGPG